MDVLVAMSGGVDSSVVAALLKSRGHAVAGVTMSVWREGRYKGGGRDACFGAGERDDVRMAEEICRRLGIPHRTVDCADAYERLVLDYFRREYLAGRTPNPCVRCNALVKFALLPGLAGEAGLGGGLFATGHYARLERGSGRVRLFRARDAAKDQSYFLYRLAPEQLERTLMPLGELAKAEVRELARSFGLPVHDKPDSQDFYDGDYRELLGVDDRPGPIVHVSGRRLGTHSGCWNFTIGQRRGLNLAHPVPLYVVDIDPGRNEVVVGEAAAAVSRALEAEDCNWLSEPPPDRPFAASLKVRSAGVPVPCRVSPLANGGFYAEFPDGVSGVSPGQSAVLYQGEMLLGGGIIKARKKPGREAVLEPAAGGA